MRINDKGMVVNLDDGDPRVARVRAILFEQPVAVAPVATLWRQCNGKHRSMLATLARGGELSQEKLERALGVTAFGLRGLLGGLAKIAKRTGVEYPVVSTGARRQVRSFALSPETKAEVWKLTKASTRRGGRR